MTDYTFVARPKAARKLWTEFLRMLAATLTNQQAVRVPMNGATYRIVQRRIYALAYQYLKRYDLPATIRTQRDGDAMCIWLEPKDAALTETR